MTLSGKLCQTSGGERGVELNRDLTTGEVKGEFWQSLTTNFGVLYIFVIQNYYFLVKKNKIIIFDKNIHKIIF